MENSQFKKRSFKRTGLFKPKFPQKYKGDPTMIIYRSSWEMKLMKYLDQNPNVLEWMSEEFYIPYYDPVKGRYRRYFPDFYVKAKDTEGKITEMVLEVKPKSQTIEPKRQSRKTKKYLREVMTWGTNEAKFKAAEKYCEERGWKFQLITERDLGIK